MQELGLMRVLHIIQPDYLPYSETFVRARVENPLVERPWLVATHTKNPDEVPRDELVIHELDRRPFWYRRICKSIDYRLGVQPYYWDICRQVRPDVVHAHFGGAALSACLPARLEGIPVISSLYGVETKHQLPGSAEWRRRFARLFRQTTIVTCLSNEMLGILLSHGCDERKAIIVPCSVDERQFPGVPKSLFDGESLRMLCVARLHPEKGQAYLLRACHELDLRGRRDWSLEMVGAGAEEETLRSLAADLFLGDRVRFRGSMAPSGVAERMRNCNVLVLPSLFESQGVVLQEAQSSGTPVIATRIGGIPEGVEDGVTGVLVPPRDPEALARAIESLWDSPEKLAAMSRAAIEYVRRRFSREKEWQTWSELYARVASR
jgi:glycosyltransferase involved in cell wall biosynthesis